MDDFLATKEELMRCDMEMLKQFPAFEQDVEMAFSYYLRAYEYYSQFYDIEDTEEAYNEYLDYLCIGKSFEEAFYWVVKRAADEAGEFDDYYNSIDLDELMQSDDRDIIETYKSIDDLAEEQDGWKYKQRIDDDLYYDPDNPLEYEEDYEDIW